MTKLNTDTPKPRTINAKAYAALPLRKRAVLLAKDVLEQIRLRNIVVQTGCYIHARYTPDKWDLSLGSRAGQAAVKDMECQVCAKGALFVANALRTNSCTVGYVYEGAGMTHRLVNDENTKAFDDDSWGLIEAAFERCASYGYYSSYEDSCEAKRFGLAFDSDEDRLIAIMLNVIRNRGRFVPKDGANTEAVLKIHRKWNNK